MVKAELKIERVIGAISALEEILKTYPGVSHGYHLLSHLTELSSYAKGKYYSFEILLLDKPDDKGVEMLQQFFKLDEATVGLLQEYVHGENSGNGIELTQELKMMTSSLRFYTPVHIPSRTTGQSIPVFKFIFWFNETAPAPADLEFVQYRLEAEGGLSILYSAAPILGLASINNFRLAKYDLAELGDKDYLAWLDDKGLTDKLQLLKPFAVVKTIEKLSTAFSQYLEQEENDIRTRKFSAQQEVNQLKQQEKLNLRDTFQRIKTDLQRDFSEFEKAVGERISALNRLQEGSLLSQTEGYISQLSYFEETEVMGKIVATLPQPFRDKLVGQIKDTCENQIEQDIFAFKDFVEQNLENLNKNNIGNFLTVPYQPKAYFNRRNLKSLLDDIMVLNKEYVAEKKKTEFQDYIRAAGKPIMVLMSFALFFRLTPFKFSNVTNALGPVLWIGVPAAVIYSFISFMKNNKKADQHFYEKEIKKMQDNLKFETRSMLKRFIDEWSRIIVAQTREELNQMLQSLEMVFVESAEEHKQRLADSQRNIQRRIQGLEQRERAHNNTVKSREQYDKAMLQLKGEINQVFMQSSFGS